MKSTLSSYKAILTYICTSVQGCVCINIACNGDEIVERVVCAGFPLTLDIVAYIDLNRLAIIGISSFSLLVVISILY